MILYGILSVLFDILQFLFGWLNLPQMPQELVVYIEQAKGLILDSLPLIWLFFDKRTVYACIIVALACVNFDKIYDFTMWIIAKLPLGISKE